MLNNQIHRNDLLSVSPVITDNRKQNDNPDTMWNKLNLSQQYAVFSLGQFGYLLTYVRTLGDSVLAILKLDDKVATINEAGTINVNPVIDCRQ